MPSSVTNPGPNPAPKGPIQSFMQIPPWVVSDRAIKALSEGGVQAIVAAWHQCEGFNLQNLARADSSAAGSSASAGVAKRPITRPVAEEYRDQPPVKVPRLQELQEEEHENHERPFKQLKRDTPTSSALVQQCDPMEWQQQQLVVAAKKKIDERKQKEEEKKLCKQAKHMLKVAGLDFNNDFQKMHTGSCAKASHWTEFLLGIAGAQNIDCEICQKLVLQFNIADMKPAGLPNPVKAAVVRHEAMAERHPEHPVFTTPPKKTTVRGRQKFSQNYCIRNCFLGQMAIHPPPKSFTLIACSQDGRRRFLLTRKPARRSLTSWSTLTPSAAVCTTCYRSRRPWKDCRRRSEMTTSYVWRCPNARSGAISAAFTSTYPA